LRKVNIVTKAEFHAQDLLGKRVLVIGGGGEGIGRSIVRATSMAGANVAVVDVVESRATEAVDEIIDNGGTAVGIVGDVLSTSDMDRVVTEASAAFGGLDVLVTVVGGQGVFAPWVPTGDTTDESWDLIMGLNLSYVFRAVRAALRVFERQETGGVIVSIGSISGVINCPNGVAYGTAKAGLINLAATVAAEYARRNVRMNVLSCGVVATPAGLVSQEQAPAMMDRIPMGRGAAPEEIAQGAVFLASDRSSYISGQNINIDGAASVHFPLSLPNVDVSAAG
jgi:3-oxoacyl-[acyl-carrier protein] reductase